MARITAGANAGQDQDPNWLGSQHEVSDADLKAAKDMGFSTDSMFSQVGGKWYGQPDTVANVTKAIHPTISQPQTTPQTPASQGLMAAQPPITPPDASAPLQAPTPAPPPGPVEPQALPEAPPTPEPSPAEDMGDQGAWQGFGGAARRQPSSITHSALYGLQSAGKPPAIVY